VKDGRRTAIHATMRVVDVEWDVQYKMHSSTKPRATNQTIVSFERENKEGIKRRITFKSDRETKE